MRLSKKKEAEKKCQPKFACSVEVTLSVIGGKWKLLVLGRINEGVSRFGQLRRIIPGITQTMLTQQLRELEEDGIVIRTIYPEIPPRVEYQVTEFGKSLETVINAMETWGSAYADTVCATKRAARGLESTNVADIGAEETAMAEDEEADLEAAQAN